MAKKIVAMALTLAFLGLATLASDAMAKRRCPPGTDDDVIRNVCTPK